MPGKLPGGKLRVSRVVPPLFTVANPTDTEVKYFGLVRDDSLSDLGSSNRNSSWKICAKRISIIYIFYRSRSEERGAPPGKRFKMSNSIL